MAADEPLRRSATGMVNEAISALASATVTGWDLWWQDDRYEFGGAIRKRTCGGCLEGFHNHPRREGEKPCQRCTMYHDEGDSHCEWYARRLAHMEADRQARGRLSRD